MKRIIGLALLFMMAGAFNQGQAQKRNVQTAYNFLKFEQFDKAKGPIDEAAVHETTLMDEKTWYYRGLIYMGLAQNENFAGKYPDALDEAYKSFAKAKEIAPKGEFQLETTQNLKALATGFFNLGAQEYNQEKYGEAVKNFDRAITANKSLGIAEGDSINLFAYLYGAYAAEKMGALDVAKKGYMKLIDLKYNDPKIYLFLAGIYKQEKNMEKAVETITLGRQVHPADNSLIIEELNFYLSSGKDKEALERIQIAIQADPKNENLYFAKGSLLDKTGDQEGASKAYKQAIELKPDYFDAYYNLGAMYFNQAAEMVNEANKIPPSKAKEYDAAKIKFEAKFVEAKPFLEKAHELNATDRNTMLSLKQLYARTGETEKYTRINKLLEAK